MNQLKKKLIIFCSNDNFFYFYVTLTLVWISKFDKGVYGKSVLGDFGSQYLFKLIL